MTAKQIEEAALEIQEYVRALVKPWTAFYGHDQEIAAIIRKHAEES